MSQILTYPWAARYSSNVQQYKTEVKDGKNGSIPFNDEIYYGDKTQDAGGVTWVSASAGSDNRADAQSQNLVFDQNSSGRGLYYYIQSSSNKTSWSRWWDLGPDGGKADGATLGAAARASFLSQVTGIWFLFTGQQTTETRDCYARVEHVAIRYIEGNTRKIRIRKVTEKIGEYTYMNGVRGGGQYIFGYQLDAAGRLEVSEKEFKLIGARVQFQVRRGAGGTHKDTLSAGMTGMRFSLGDSSTGGITNNTMKALVGKGNTPWNEWDREWPKLQLETRP